MIGLLRLALGMLVFAGSIFTYSTHTLGQSFPFTSLHSQEVPNVNGAASPSGSQHRAQILFEDKIEKRQWTKQATEVPQTIAWVKVGEDWQPVTRIEITGTVEQRRISKFAQDGSFLESTIQAPSRPK